MAAFKVAMTQKAIEKKSVNGYLMEQRDLYRNLSGKKLLVIFIGI